MIILIILLTISLITIVYLYLKLGSNKVKLGRVLNINEFLENVILTVFSTIPLNRDQAKILKGNLDKLAEQFEVNNPFQIIAVAKGEPNEVSNNQRE